MGTEFTLETDITSRSVVLKLVVYVWMLIASPTHPTTRDYATCGFSDPV